MTSPPTHPGSLHTDSWGCGPGIPPSHPCPWLLSSAERWGQPTDRMLQHPTSGPLLLHCPCRWGPEPPPGTLCVFTPKMRPAQGPGPPVRMGPLPAVHLAPSSACGRGGMKARGGGRESSQCLFQPPAAPCPAQSCPCPPLRAPGLGLQG